MVGVNRGIRQYSAAQKRAYYARKRLSGQGAYRIGRPYVSGSGAYKMGRKKRYIRGRGAYSIPKDFFNARALGAQLGSAGGAAIGNFIAPGIGGEGGRAIGAKLGEMAGGLFKRLTGYGAYQINYNTLLPGMDDRVVPSFGEDSIRVKKREFIANIESSVDFHNNTFPINPGLSDVFPWLCEIANNYEQYRFNGLVFQFVSTSSMSIASSTNLAMGTIIMSTDYNAADDPYVSEQQMLGTMFSNSAAPNQDIMHAVECAPTDQAQKLYYIRSGDNPSNTDIRLYDMGVFQLATEGMQTGNWRAGQLWVSYDITLCKSVQNNTLGFNLNTDKYQLNNQVAGTTGPYAPFGADRILDEHSNLGTTVTKDTITFPPTISEGFYLLNWGCYGGADATTLPVETLTNCQRVTCWLNNTVDTISNGGETTSTYSLIRIYKLLDRDASIHWEGPLLLPSFPIGGDLIITQVNGEILEELET